MDRIMHVKKRNGDLEVVSFDKVLNRISNLSSDLDVNPFEIAQKICTRIFDGVPTHQLDELTAQLCSSLCADNPSYDQLAARIAVSNHHKRTSPSFSETIRMLYMNDGYKLVSEEVWSVVEAHKDKLNSYIDYERDYLFDYFGFRTLERAYLTKNTEGVVIERPQHMFMRVAIGIHGTDIKEVLETYDGMSKKLFIHATPTLFNYGTPRQQGSSCFLLNMNSDSIQGIYESLGECAAISKYAGGIGMHIHNVRASGSVIRGTNGHSDGIVPMLRVFNATARYVNQSGRRNGSIAIYLEPWHADVEKFLMMRKNHGNEEERARDLFYALWVPDLFMHRVKSGGSWSLMCPDRCPGLSDVYGDDFVKLYESYEAEGRASSTIDAKTLWLKILESQIETGTPYMLYKDACNRKSNQQNLGTIKSSNLCCEIVEYTSPEEIAVCNLASLCLPSYLIPDSTGKAVDYDFDALGKSVRILTRNLNKLIDRNFYPLEKAARSNKAHRPIAIGVQGLTDTYMQLRYPYESERAFELNRRIFETIYYNAVVESCAIAEKYGPYDTFAGSPMSKGLFQFDLWDAKPCMTYDWDSLRERVMTHGVRNSLLVAPMPTASTAQIMGNTESFEIPTSNIYKRKTLAGEFIVINKHLIRDLTELGLWDKDMKESVLMNDGSVQGNDRIPECIQQLYKTAWEIKQRAYIDQAKERGIYICQSQSMNLFIDSPTLNKMNSVHFYTWECGLKTGMYYLRTKPKASAQKFSIAPKQQQQQQQEEDHQPCESCSA
jgi:ribonucleoside-diphosphate reductase alpha subunit